MGPSFAPEGLRERRRTVRSSHDDQSKPLPPLTDSSFEEMSLSPIARLWQASNKDLSYQGDGGSGGQARSWSFGNILTAIQLIQLLFWGVIDLLLRDTLRDAGIFLARKAMQGVMPAAKVWAQKEMLDIVQTSFEKPLELSHVIWVAVRSTAFDSFEGLAGIMTQGSEERFQERLNRKIAQAYVAAEMALAVPAMSSPYTAALLADARGFCHGSTDTSGVLPPRDAFSSITGIARVASLLLATITQAFLLLRTLAFGASDSYFSLPSLVMLGLGLYPSAAVFLRTQIMAHYARLSSEVDQSLPALRARLQQVRDMRLSPEFTQDVMIPRLRSWVLEKGNGEEQTDLERTIRTITATALVDWGTRLSTTSVENVLHVLLATRLLGTGFSLGSVRTFRASATSLLSTTQALGVQVDLVYQSIFQLAAFFEATQNPRAVSLAARLDTLHDHPVIDYETSRKGRGMRIRARDLGFADESDGEVGLRGIDFDLREGESIALIGDDDTAKQMLIEVLLSLRQHMGELLINDQPPAAYDPTTLFARTACLSCETVTALGGNAQQTDASHSKKNANPQPSSSGIATPTVSVSQWAVPLERARFDADRLTPGGWPSVDVSPGPTPIAFPPVTQAIGTPRRQIDLSRAKAADLVVCDTSIVGSEADEILLIRDLGRLMGEEQGSKPTIIWMCRHSAAANLADQVVRVTNGGIEVVKTSSFPPHT